MSVFSGQVQFDATIGRVRSALLDTDYIKLLTGEDAGLGKIGDQTYTFLIIRTVGLLPVRLPGTLTITHAPGSNQFLYSASAAHKIAGTVKSDFTMTLSENNGGCSLHYDGKVEATGLFGTVMQNSEDRAKGRLERVFGEIGAALKIDNRSSAAGPSV